MISQWRIANKPLAAAAAVVIAACAIAARHQVGYWSNSVSLWQHARDVSPGSYTEANLANAYAADGKSEEAVGHFIEAVRIRPDDTKALTDFGSLLQKQGKIDEAIAAYSQALRIKPDAIGHYTVALLLRRRGREPEAILHLRAALRLQPDLVPARVALERIASIPKRAVAKPDTAQR